MNFNALDFSVVYENFLILYTISIGWERNLSYDFIRNSLLNLDSDDSVPFNNLLNNSVDFDNFILLDVYYHLLLYFNSLNLLDFSYDDLRNLNLNDLKDRNLHKDNFLNYLRYFDNFLDNSRNNYYLLNDPFNLYNSRYLDYLLNYLFNYLLLDSNNFPLHHNRYRLFNKDLLDNFLFDRNNFAFLYLKLSHFLSAYWNTNLCNNRYLFSNIARNNFFYLYISACQYFMYDRLIYKALNFFNNLCHISFNEMRSLNVNLLRNLSDHLFLLCYTDFLHNLFHLISHDYLISVLDKLDDPDLRHSDLNWDFSSHIDDFFLLDVVVYVFLDLDVLWLFYYVWDFYLDLSDRVLGFIDVEWLLYYPLDLNIVSIFSFNQNFLLANLYFVNYLLNLNFLHNLFSII